MPAAVNSFQATGRRRTSVARVIMRPGTGKMVVNNRPYEEYFPSVSQQNLLLQPFQVTNSLNKFDLQINAKGGGISGQVGAIRLAVSRALILHDPDLRPDLKKENLLRRDPRMKERKKAGQPGARKRFQFSKR